MRYQIYQGGRSARRRGGIIGRLRTFWRRVVVRRLLLAISGWALIEGGRAEGGPGRAA
ncbi:MAG TPA: hypothetical protein VFI53_22375 [Myxococcaceae bacterium]|nr:hypothetical protein [Myxococcaceae bacterium]